MVGIGYAHTEKDRFKFVRAIDYPVLGFWPLEGQTRESFELVCYRTVAQEPLPFLFAVYNLKNILLIRVIQTQLLRRASAGVATLISNAGLSF